LALASKGRSLRKSGKYQEAIEHFDKALEVYPKNKGVLNNKGLALDSLGKYEDAKGCYDKARELGLNI
jgi:Flp pilus assembly protein TadD